MEIGPHFRVVRFSPTPEVVEPVNVALLIVNGHARLISDNEFQKLGCIAPRYNTNILKFWLEELQEELRCINPNEAHVFLATRSAQFFVGEPQKILSLQTKEFETKLVELYLRRQTKPHKAGESHTQYVDSLLDKALELVSFDSKMLIRRARLTDIFSEKSLSLLPSRNIRFSRVLAGTKKIVLMDGLNLAISAKDQLRRRAQEIGFGFYAIGNSRAKLEDLENKQIVRTSFVFNKPTIANPEMEYCVAQLKRDSDLLVDDSTFSKVALKTVLASATEDLFQHKGYWLS